ncbi:hypothetical protein FACS1894116_03950 [Betaproteobacteria bacterium]|nr:hypothetical protein FACS1894116_03950 [Betaproteobacteria bacterium]GHU22542.1 hypothetical protein FACS189488_03300 [Betaproteobacteria bacterium]
MEHLHRYERQAGFTLIELMVSLLLGLIVLGGIVGVFLANREVHRDMEGLNRIHENARVAFDLMGRSLREAGGNPCGVPASMITNKVTTPTGAWYATPADYSQDYILGKKGAAAASISVTITKLAGGSHDIEYSTGDSIRFLTSGSTTGGTSAVQVGASGFTPKEAAYTGPTTIGLICDKSKGYIWSPSGSFTPSSTDAGGNLTATNAYVTDLIPEYWFISNNERGGKSLYRTTHTDTTVEIAPNVTDMQLTYLLQGGDEYKNADALSGDDWAKLAAVRIELTLANFSVPAPSSLEGSYVTPIERTLAHTVALRGRNLPVPAPTLP